MNNSKKPIAIAEYVHEAKAAQLAKLNTIAGLSYEITEKSSNRAQKNEVLVDGKAAEVTSSQTPTSAELYLFSFVDYVCTHNPEQIKPCDSIYSEIESIPWEMFCSIVLLGTKGQKEIMQREIRNFARLTPGRVINLQGRAVTTALFSISLHGKKGKYNARELQRIAALNRLPVEYITIRFVSELFNSVFFDDHIYSNLPTGWYAKIRKQTMDAQSETGIEGADIDIHASIYEKTWAYLNYHDNGMYREKKVNVWSLLLETTGMTYMRITKGKFYLRHETGHDAYAFLANVIRTLQDASHIYRKNLNFEITGWGLTEDIFDMKKLEVAKKTTPPDLIIKTIIDTMIARYDGYIKITVIRNPKLTQQELPLQEDKK
jgi:hypothetical protein